MQFGALGVNVIASDDATGIEAIGQNIAMDESSVVVNSDSRDVNVQGIVASGGSISVAGYTDLSVSGNGALTAISASGPSASGQPNIDLQGGASLMLIRIGTIRTALMAWWPGAAQTYTSPIPLTLASDANVSETDRF